MSSVHDDVRVMTYAEFAIARGITVQSARRMARRFHWHKTMGNDKVARIAVPLSAIPAEMPVPQLDPLDERQEVPQSVLIEWLIEANRRADERVARAESRADRAEAQIVAAYQEIARMREEYLRDLQDLRVWQTRLLDRMQPWWRTVIGRNRRPADPPIGSMLSSSTGMYSD